MGKTFRAWAVDQVWLLPPSLQDLVPAGHRAHFVRDTVRHALDRSAIMAVYDEDRGYPPYHPGMMTALLLHGCCPGVHASRRIAQAGEERLDFAAPTGMQRPDFRTVLDHPRPYGEGDPALRAELARLLQSQRRYVRAEQGWRDVLDSAPQDPTALQGKIRSLRQQHRFEDAGQIVASGLAAVPGSRLLIVESARLAMQREAFAEAARCYHAALALPRSTGEILGELADVHVACHRFTAAQAILDRLVAAEPDNTAWRVARATAAQEQGDARSAVRRWGEALDLDVRHLKARVAIGRIHEESGRLGEVEATFRDLAETHPHAIEPLLELARMALSQADTAPAITWLERALELRPEDWQAASRMVRAIAAQHRFGKARSLAQTLVARLPDHIDAHVLVAWVEERAGHLGRADRALQAVTSQFPQAFVPSLRRVELLLRGGQPLRALTVLDQAHEKHPETFSLSLARVDAAFAAGRERDAACQIEALHELYPEHSEVRKRLARVELAEDRYGSARRLWAEVTRYDSRVSGPPVHLERLDTRPIPEPAGEVRLFTRLRNEYLRLPWLFDYYRGQDVDRFFVADNGSDDGSRDYLLSRPDTHVFLTTDSYAEYGGGQRWLNHLLNRYGSGTWCLTVDVDEILAYPHAEILDLKALTAHLDRHGAQALFSFMLDMYGEGSLGQVAYRPGDHPLAACPCFDRSGYFHRDCPDFPYHLIVGGLVSRYLFDRKQDGVFLHKVPLVRWQEGLHYAGSTHTLSPVPLADETSILLHVKFMADFIDRAEIESQRKQYWQGAKRYTEFNRRFQNEAAVDFRCELTERFVSTAQLAALGLMRTTPALDAIAAALDAAEPLPGWRSTP